VKKQSPQSVSALLPMGFKLLFPLVAEHHLR
jgi:hypothetical protein